MIRHCETCDGQDALCQTCNRPWPRGQPARQHAKEHPRACTAKRRKVYACLDHRKPVAKCDVCALEAPAESSTRNRKSGRRLRVEVYWHKPAGWSAYGTPGDVWPTGDSCPTCTQRVRVALDGAIEGACATDPRAAYVERLESMLCGIAFDSGRNRPPSVRVVANGVEFFPLPEVVHGLAQTEHGHVIACGSSTGHASTRRRDISCDTCVAEMMDYDIDEAAAEGRG